MKTDKEKEQFGIHASEGMQYLARFASTDKSVPGSGPAKALVSNLRLER